MIFIIWAQPLNTNKKAPVNTHLQRPNEAYTNAFDLSYGKNRKRFHPVADIYFLRY